MARRRLSPTIAESGRDVPRAEHPEDARPRPALAEPGLGVPPSPFTPTPSIAPPIARVAAEAAGRAALDEVVETLTRAREEGRMVIEIPLDDIAADHIARDRHPGGPGTGAPAAGEANEEMTALIESIRVHGQRMPLEVTALRGPASDEGRDGGFARGRLPYGLISGWRRLAALRALFAETGEERFATARALLRRPENAAEAYVAMVEENEIRLGLSQYERARVAAVAAARGVFPSEKAALLALFATASRAKRSRIRAFVELYHALDAELSFPVHLPERLGLRLVELVRAGQAAALAEALPSRGARNPEIELAALEAAAARLEAGKDASGKDASGKTRAETSATAAEEGWSWERVGPDLELGTRAGPRPELRLRGAGVTPEVVSALRSAIRGVLGAG